MIRFLGGALFFAVVGSSVWALDPRTGGTTLLETMDARAAALGEAGSTLTGDLSGVAFNPALLTAMDGAQLETQFQVAPGDVRTGLVAYGRGGPRLGWSASVVYLDAGTIEIVPAAGAPSTKKAQQDLVGTFSAGAALAPWLRVGGTVKGLQSELVDEYTATVVAGDAGVLINLPFPGWRLGGSAQNVGPDLTYKNTGDPLPTFYRGGISYTYSSEGGEPSPSSSMWYSEGRNSGRRIWVGADAVVDRWGSVVGNLGVEWEHAQMASLRFGGILDENNLGFTAGFGFLIKQWRLDYAIQLVEDISDRHRVSVSYFWKTDN
jgi:hypothetical protein